MRRFLFRLMSLDGDTDTTGRTTKVDPLTALRCE
jgi:hypothetical protein